MIRKGNEKMLSSKTMVVLRNLRFVENSREEWFNRELRIHFSYEVLRDHENDVAWLKARVSENVPEFEFRFHSNDPLPLEISAAILRELQLTNLIPMNQHWISSAATRV
jgi:hypothetical protein